MNGNQSDPTLSKSGWFVRYQPVFLKAFEGYRSSDFFKDIGAGLTVGIIALPLAIGFGIASGAENPGQGLWTAIIAGAIVALFGGSRFQIAGPTGAFIPVLAGIVAVHGYEGLLLATMMAGILLVALGLLRMGMLLRYIPYPVVAGFTSGIAVIIFVSQLPDFLGLSFERPGHLPELVWEVAGHAGGMDWRVAATGGLSFAIALFWPKRLARVPAAIVAVLAGSILVYVSGWPVETIGAKFGEFPSGFPAIRWPQIDLQLIRDLSGPAFTIAALGSIESLLSATVADGMAETRHDANSELVGQGLANILSPLFGGFAATGAIARTAANIRSGARSPLAGVIHSLVLVVFVLVAGPLVAHIPIATLSAVLMAVAVRMAEWDTFAELWRGSRSDFLVMGLTFALTVIFDLTVGVAAGLIIAVILFVRRMEGVSSVGLLTEETDTEHDGSNSLRGKNVPEGVILFRFEGPLFFAAAEKLEGALRSHGARPKIVIFRMRHVPSIDATALHAMEVALEKMHRDGVTVLFSAVQAQPMKAIRASGLAESAGVENFFPNLDRALEKAVELLAASTKSGAIGGMEPA
ncbi:MAG: STAS domain-containing protein [Verrucomicrobiae bacterium]|nr:STAS domain-containing protein [Verrucomicrobiae bacterium]